MSFGVIFLDLSFVLNKTMTITLTKIVCTIGPETSSKEAIKRLIGAGMSIARLNFSHGSMEDHLAVIRNIKDAREEAGRYVAIALDTKGPETRICTPNGTDMKVSTGDIIRCSTVSDRGSVLISPISIKSLRENDKVFIDDGLLGLKVVEVGEDYFSCEVLNEHNVKNNKSMSFPGIDMGLKSLSEKDREDIIFGMDNGIDFIFASFINGSSDIGEIREFVGSRDIFVVSKIESLRAMRELEDIVLASDGVMAARGDLGVETGLENLFSAQKMIFAICRRHNKPLICATQMMESMTGSNIPTRAEISDVGNAVLDGCDCVMLSGETAVGLFPTRTVDFMRRICLDAEEHARRSQQGPKLHVLGIDSVVVATDSISKVESMYSACSTVPVILISEDRKLLGRFCIYKGIIPVFADRRDGKEIHSVLRKLGFNGKSLIIGDEMSVEDVGYEV